MISLNKRTTYSCFQVCMELLVLCLYLQPAIAEATTAISCNIVIIGGGAGGVHTAYQLGKLPDSNPNSDVCLFEKLDRLGGRIYDVALNPARPDLVFGTGALRVMETQNYVFQLAIPSPKCANVTGLLS